MSEPHTSEDIGRLEVICGPMFVGKTTELIRRIRAAEASGLSVLAVKHQLDDRYDARALATHDGRRIPASTIEQPNQLLEFEEDVIGLDESHFFKVGLHPVVMELLGKGRRVILAGLDRTSLNEPFGEMARLLIEADEVVKISGTCAVCGGIAVHTVRLFDSRDDIVVGGSGMFENRCRRHLSVSGSSS